METEFFLIINSSGGARVAKRPPSLGHDEISMRMNVELPDQMFRRPMLQANITIPTNVVQPNIINTEMVDNVERVIRETTNLDFRVRLVDYEDEREDNG